MIKENMKMNGHPTDISHFMDGLIRRLLNDTVSTEKIFIVE
jgi:hypothetical protein